MPCCCVKVLNLCNVPVCGELEIKQAAGPAESGAANLYTLVLDYFDTAISLVQEQTEGENIKFSIGKLNENFLYTGQVFDSNGDLLHIAVGEIIYDCVKFKTIIALNAETGTATPPVLNLTGTVVIEAVIDEEPVVTGTSDAVTGVEDGSTTITCEAFVGVRVIVIRGNVPIPGINPLDGSTYFTKSLGADFITLSDPLESGEFIRIQTIPL